MGKAFANSRQILGKVLGAGFAWFSALPGWFPELLVVWAADARRLGVFFRAAGLGAHAAEAHGLVRHGADLRRPGAKGPAKLLCIKIV